MEQKCFEQRAENVGWIRDFYPDYVDSTWSDIEAKLAAALAELTDGTIDALKWAGTLVPFVASILVRGPDFNKRFEERIEKLVDGGVDVSEDNTGGARVLEMQRLLAPILAAQWIVCSVKGEGDLITNDAGFVRFQAPQVGAYGIAIPLGRHHVLQLFPSMSREIALAREGKWQPVITYQELRTGNHIELNEAMTKGAARYVYGPSNAAVGNFLSACKSAEGKSPEPGMMGFVGGEMARRNEFSWHWLISILSKSVNDRDVWLSGIDWEAVAAQGKGTVVFPLNVPMGIPGLTKVGSSIFIDLQAAAQGEEEKLGAGS